MTIETLTFERAGQEAAIVITENCAAVYEPGELRYITKYLHRALARLEARGYHLLKTSLPYGIV